MTPLLALSKKGFRLLFTLAKIRICLDTQLKGEQLICIKNSLGVHYSIRQSRNRMMNTFIIFNITPTYKRWFREKIYACLLQKRLLSPFVLDRNRMFLGTYLKNELTSFFWKLPRVWHFLFPNTDWVDCRWWTLC